MPKSRYFLPSGIEDAEASCSTQHIDEGGHDESRQSPRRHKQYKVKSEASDEDQVADFEEKLLDAKAERRLLKADKVVKAGIKTKFRQEEEFQRQQKLVQNKTLSAQASILQNEPSGCIEVEEGDRLYPSQAEIIAASPVGIAHKKFDLDLPKFGPYRIDYTRNGRHMLLGGKHGHVAAIDMATKRLCTEFSALQTVRDVCFLQHENMFAVAQNESSYLFWLDVSMGKLVAHFPTKLGPGKVMCQNPSNAIIHMGHSTGVVTMWSPNVQEPLVRVLCHTAPVKVVSVERSGRYMSTVGLDRRLRIWDLRSCRPLQTYAMPLACSNLAFSDTGLLAAATGSSVQIFKQPWREQTDSTPKIYLSHRLRHTITSLHFQPYEDVLGIGHLGGFSSILVPGAGEANIDALEANPYQTKRQRREAEVRSLMDKIQPEMITLDTSRLMEVDQETMEEKKAEQSKKHHLNPKDVKLKKKKVKGQAMKKHLKAKSKKREENIRAMLQEQEANEKEEKKRQKTLPATEGGSVLNRFNRK